jgi:hypothetical protein
MNYFFGIYASTFSWDVNTARLKPSNGSCFEGDCIVAQRVSVSIAAAITTAARIVCIAFILPASALPPA